MSTHDGATFPFDTRPDRALWKRSVEGLSSTELDPYAPVRFTLTKETLVASGGSCFARHIATNLRRHGFNYFSTEPGAEYSANFGNVYTTLQLLQLLQRAYGVFTPAEASWKHGERLVDPLRPRAFPDGFADVAELVTERDRHLAAVRRLFEELDVFVFTLGLTEGFCSKADGTAYPACPGKGFGEFDSALYEFRNLTLAENVSYLGQFLDGLKSVNPKARVLLTVSPVPLVATMENRSVIQSTVYSKSVLRVCADEIRRQYENVDYFWSYEIITATYNMDRYFEPDRRSVNESGVAHVMRSFFKHFTDVETVDPAIEAQDPCDEDVLHAMIKAAAQG